MTQPASPFGALRADVIHQLVQATLACEDAQAEAAAGQCFVPGGSFDLLLGAWISCKKPTELGDVWSYLVQRSVAAGTSPRLCLDLAPLDALLRATREALPPGWRSYYHHRGHR